MNFEFLSGLLLIAVTLAIVFFVVKELFDDRGSAYGKARQYFGHSFERFSGGEAKPVNAHLIGTVGKVVSHTDDSARPMRVELGRESWPARLPSSGGGLLPVGDTVSVLEVDGAVLVVAASEDFAGPSNAS